MVARYWVGDGGDWSDALLHWSAADGGAPNASKPTIADNVYFTPNSFTIGGQTVTVDETAYYKDMDWTGVTNNPTFAGASGQNSEGASIVYVAAMTITATGYTTYSGATHTTITMNGNTYTQQINLFKPNIIYKLSFLDDFLSTHTINVQNGTFYPSLTVPAVEVTCVNFNSNYGSTRGVNLGSAVINCAAVSFQNITNLTFDAGISTVKVRGTGTFNGGGLAWNIVELNGTAHTISGDNTFDTLSFNPAGAQALTFTDTSTQTVSACFRTGAGIITMAGTGAGGWAIVKSGGSWIALAHMDIAYSTATPAGTWYAIAGSVDSGGNSGWEFSAENIAKINGVELYKIAGIGSVIH